jgi:hypothetical protein
LTLEAALLFGGAQLLLTVIATVVATRRTAALTGERWGRLEATMTAIEAQLGVVTTRLNQHAERLRQQELACDAQAV